MLHLGHGVYSPFPLVKRTLIACMTLNQISKMCMLFVNLMLARGGVDGYLLRPAT